MRRSLALTCIAVIAAAGLGGCASQTGGDPAAAEASFLAALAKGDGDAALALTTTSRSSMACPDLVSEYKTLGGGIAAATTGKSTVDGDKATVAYSYSVVTNTAEAVKATGTDTLVLRGGKWLIELPSADRISATVPTDVVAELSIGGSGDSAGACATKPANGSVELPALPGSYRLELRDPTGVFDSASSTSYAVVTGDKKRQAKITFINSTDRDLASTAIRNALLPLVDECASSGFVSTACPTGLPTPGGDVTLADRPGARFTDYPTVTKIFSDDGKTWRFTAGGQSFTYLQAGAPETFPMAYAGTVTASPAKDGTVQIALDK